MTSLRTGASLLGFPLSSEGAPGVCCHRHVYRRRTRRCRWKMNVAIGRRSCTTRNRGLLQSGLCKGHWKLQAYAGDEDEVEEKDEDEEGEGGGLVVEEDVIGNDETSSTDEIEGMDSLSVEDSSTAKAEEEAELSEELEEVMGQFSTSAAQARQKELYEEQKRFQRELELELMRDDPIAPEHEWYYKDMERLEWDLAELLDLAGYPDHAEKFKECFGDVKISGMQTDHKKVQKGDIYFCEETEEHNGMDHVEEATEKGAVVLVVPPRDEGQEEDEIAVDEDLPVLMFSDFPDAMARLANVYYGDPSSEMTVIGVAGTTGKSTVCWLIRSILEKHGLVTGMMSDLGHTICQDNLDLDGNIWKSDDVDVAAAHNSTTPYHVIPYKGRYRVEETLPNPIQIQKLLRGMVSRGAEACVIECPSVNLAQTHLTYVDFTLAVFTNLYEEQDEAKEGNFQEYKSRTGKLFQSLEDPSRQRAIINLDGSSAEDFVNFSHKVPVVTYSMYPGADVHILQTLYTIWDTELVIQTPVGRMRVVTSVIGKTNVENVMAAVAAAISINIPLKVILEGLENSEAVPGRMEVLDEGQEGSFSVVVDNAHTPERLGRLLENARSTGVKHVLLVMGGKGGEDHSICTKLMEVAHFKAHMVFLTNDNPRFDHPTVLIDKLVEGIPENLREPYKIWVDNPFQDLGRVSWWFEDYLRSAQGQLRRYVCEDRALAIKTAIGTAQDGDIVVITGRGDEDFQEFPDESGENLERCWFDDRREARDALKKLKYLKNLKLDRKQVPWERLKK